MAWRYAPSPSQPSSVKLRSEGVYIQLAGDVSLKGTLFFDHPPDLGEIIPSQLKIGYSKDVAFQFNQFPIVSHSLIEFLKNDTNWCVSRKELPAYQKLTLGILISVNQETEEGLMALPGIGPKTARILIHERQKRGGFKDLNELRSLPGIGKGLFQKIQPVITL